MSEIPDSLADLHRRVKDLKNKVDKLTKEGLHDHNKPLDKQIENYENIRDSLDELVKLLKTLEKRGDR